MTTPRTADKPAQDASRRSGNKADKPEKQPSLLVWLLPFLIRVGS